MNPKEAIDVWLAELADQRRLSSHTIAGYRQDLTKLCQDAGETPLASLQTHHVRRYVAQWHGRGLSGRSLARMLSAWRGFFAWLGERGLIPVNPCDGLRPPKSPKMLPKALSVDEAARLMEQPEVADERIAIRDQAMFELFYSSGLRLSELTALNLDVLQDIDRDDEVRVLGKRAKTRVVPVGTMAKQALLAWAAVRGELARPGEAALFVGLRGGRISGRVVELQLGRRAQQLGLAKHVHPHMLRHSFASHVLQSSGDLRAVQEMLGHASIASTQAYTHLDFQHLAKVYDTAHPRAKLRRG